MQRKTGTIDKPELPGTSPKGVIGIVECDAEPYDERAVMAKIVQQGRAAVKSHLEQLLDNGKRALYNEAIEYLIENMMPIPDHDNSAVLKKNIR